MNGRSVRGRCLLPRPALAGGKNPPESKSQGVRGSLHALCPGLFHPPPAPLPTSKINTSVESGGNYSLMLLPRKPPASLPSVLPLRPEQTLFSCLSLGDVPTGKCLPSHTLSWLEILYLEPLGKPLPSLSRGKARASLGMAINCPYRIHGTQERSLSLRALCCAMHPSPKKHLVHRGFWGAGLIPVMCHPLVHFYSFFLEPTPPELLFHLAPCIPTPGTETHQHQQHEVQSPKPEPRASHAPHPSRGINPQEDKPSEGG